MLDRIIKAQHEIEDACRTIGRPVMVMEVCGTHTVAIFRNGIRSILPANLKLLSGPGCPVCVTDQGYIDVVLEIAARGDCIVASYGDMIRVPGHAGSLETLATRSDVRIVMSSEDALQLARDNPGKTVVFVAVGFETTAPATAVAVKEAARDGVKNFCILSGHKLVLPAMRALLGGLNDRVDGFLCPGHVSVIIGAGAFREIVNDYGRPCVVAGFEPVQIVEGLAEICRQIAVKKPELKSVYGAVVSEEGNRTAQAVINECFVPVDGPWRGLGVIKQSTLALREPYRQFDAFAWLGVKVQPTEEFGGCRCGEVLCGRIDPPQCPLFGKACTPEHPVGPCMVSSEGTCAAWFRYNRGGQST